MKGTTIFGGTQLIIMLVNLLRGKLVAMILGAYGMGINALLQSALQPIQAFFSLGMPQSAVSIVATEKADDNPQRLHQTVKAFRRVMMVMSLMAVVFTVSFAPLLNDVTLSKSMDFTRWFMALSIAVFFMIQTAGNTAILQGCRSLKHLAICNVAGPVSGLVISVPIYYFMGCRGIAPAIIVVAAAMWAVSQWYVSKLKLGNVRQSWSDTYGIAKPIVMLGMVMMVAGLLGNFSVYIINMFIRSIGNVADVGFYQASITITTQCTAMVFTALATDYFPKLSQTVKDRRETLQLIGQEGEIVLLLCAPISVLLIAFAPMIVSILLTEEFLVIVPVVQMMALTFAMRAVHFPLDYMSVACNDKRFYFWTEGVLCNIKTFAIFALSYYLWGLIGLGYASLINGMTDIIVSFTLIPWRFGVMYNWRYFRLMIVLFSVVTLVLLAALMLEGYVSMLLMAIGCTLVCIYSLYELNRRLDISQLIRSRLGKRQ